MIDMPSKKCCTLNILCQIFDHAKLLKNKPKLSGDKTSSATGYLDEDDNFVGRVYLSGILYHVEPALRHNLPEYDSVMYRGSQEPFLHSELVRTLQPPRSAGIIIILRITQYKTVAESLVSLVTLLGF